MKLFDIFSRHPRGELSAHADGELAPDRLRALEAHLTGCARCRTELDELLAVRSALRDLPQVAAPRSFTLTPAMAERKRAPVTSRATPSFVAMRVAGAGFAAVLAVVVMLDAGGIIDDAGGRSGDESSTALFESDPTNRDTEAYGLLPGDDAAATSAASDGELPATGGGGIGGPDGSGDANSDDADPPFNQLADDGEQQLPDPTTVPGDAQNSLNIDGDDDATESEDGAPAALTAEDDGVSSLLIIEIGLAAIALIAIGGSFVMRRRSESE